MRAASGFEPQTKRLETRALVGSATREAFYQILYFTPDHIDALWTKTLGHSRQA